MMLVSVTEKNALIRAKDATGDSFLIYPITKAENVDGFYSTINSIETNVTNLESAVEGKADAEHEHTHITDGNGVVEVLGKMISYDRYEVSLVPSRDGTSTVAGSIDKDGDVQPDIFFLGEYANPWAGLYISSDGAIMFGKDVLTEDKIANQNTFSKIAVDSTTIEADQMTDTLTLAGSNVTLTPDATNDKVTIGITKDNVTSALGYTPPTTNTTYSAATTSAAGLMSASDKSKLDGIASGANAYTLPTATSSTLGGVKTGSNITNSSGTISITKANVTSALGYTPPTTNTTYSAATTSAAGLMSASDKSKLDGIASGANAYTLPTATSSTLGGVKTGSNITNSSGTISITKDNVTSALGYTPPTTNTTYSAATTSAAGLMSASDKSKLDGIITAPITTSGDGSAYTATVSGITSLSAGANFVMIPHVVSTSTQPTLNVNGLGAKYIRRRLSTATGTTVVGNSASWLTAGKPVYLVFDGTYWIVDVARPSASDIYGTIPISSGGTGATTAAGALTNIGAMPNVSVTSSDAGKFLRVSSDGVWVAESLQNAEEVSI